jgi:hypothetical protein
VKFVLELLIVVTFFCFIGGLCAMPVNPIAGSILVSGAMLTAVQLLRLSVDVMIEEKKEEDESP